MWICMIINKCYKICKKNNNYIFCYLRFMCYFVLKWNKIMILTTIQEHRQSHQTAKYKITHFFLLLFFLIVCVFCLVLIKYDLNKMYTNSGFICLIHLRNFQHGIPWFHDSTIEIPLQAFSAMITLFKQLIGNEQPIIKEFQHVLSFQEMKIIKTKNSE